MPSKNKIKNFIREVRIEHDKRIADYLGGGGSSEVFTGATSISAGAAGLVPQPLIGAENYFLRGDGNWASIAGGQDSAAYVLSDHISTIEGGFWAEEIDDKTNLRLRHGDYIYNFRFDAATLVDVGGSTTATVEPDTYFLGTTPVTVEGGLWYDTSETAPVLKMRKGSYIFDFWRDNVTWAGGNTNLASYLQFNTSATNDALGNTWTAYGSPTVADGKLNLDGNSYLLNSGIAASVGSKPWAIDFWLTPTATNNSNTTFFCTYNANVATSGSGTNYWVSLFWNNGTPSLAFYGAMVDGTVAVGIGERHHYAVSYDGTTLRFFLDGILNSQIDKEITLGGAFSIGAGVTGPPCLKGTIERFRLFSGTAVWTEDFTLPTASDYL